VLGHDQRLRRGQIEHLAGGVANGRPLAQGLTAPAAGFGEMIDALVGFRGDGSGGVAPSSNL
jgi:hypothetical protein